MDKYIRQGNKDRHFNEERRPFAKTGSSFAKRDSFSRGPVASRQEGDRSFAKKSRFGEDRPSFRERRGDAADSFRSRSAEDRPFFKKPRFNEDRPSFRERSPRREGESLDRPSFRERRGDGADSFRSRPSEDRPFFKKPRFNEDRPSFRERSPRREGESLDRPSFRERRGDGADSFRSRSAEDRPFFKKPRFNEDRPSFRERSPGREGGSEDRPFFKKPRFSEDRPSFRGRGPRREEGSTSSYRSRESTGRPSFGGRAFDDKPSFVREERQIPVPSELFISCQPSLEELLYEELQELGINVVKVGFAGVHVEGSLENVYKINYLSRLAGKVLLPIAAFGFSHPEVFYKQALRVEWSKWLSLETTFVIKINGQSPLFNNTLYAAQLLKDAICDQFREKTGERPSISLKEPDVVLHLFLEHEQAVVYFDTSHEPLFKRGWRREAAPAPLQETMAAAVLRLAGYKGEGLFCDPCCGGGTLLIEAALIATKTPPGFFRTSWGFEKLPEHNEALWQQIKQEADNQREALREGAILGIDYNKDAIRISKVNLLSAGFEDQITLLHSSFSEASLPERFDLLVANPPHGERLGEEENLAPLYRALGDFIKHKGRHKAKAFVYTSSLALSKEIGLKADKRHVISSSGQECRVIELSVNHSSEES